MWVIKHNRWLGLDIDRYWIWGVVILIMRPWNKDPQTFTNQDFLCFGGFWLLMCFQSDVTPNMYLLQTGFYWKKGYSKYIAWYLRRAFEAPSQRWTFAVETPCCFFCGYHIGYTNLPVFASENLQPASFVYFGENTGSSFVGQMVWPKQTSRERWSFNSKINKSGRYLWPMAMDSIDSELICLISRMQFFCFSAPVWFCKLTLLFSNPCTSSSESFSKNIHFQ